MKCKKPILVFVILLVLVQQVSAQYRYCNDSDNGQNYAVEGTLTYSTEIAPEPGAKSFTDHCYDFTGRGVLAFFCNHPNCFLIEYSCTGAAGNYNYISKKIDCNALGFDGCKNGECVESVEPIEPIAAGCDDGTPEGKCSENKPLYCDDGLLGDYCRVCGCPESNICASSNSCVPIQVGCSDGTPEESCSSTKPKYCDDGDLKEKCQTCGCPPGKGCLPSGSCATEILRSCDNGIVNQDETDVDCGGDCLPCNVGERCSEDDDCYRSVCNRGICSEMERKVPEKEEQEEVKPARCAEAGLKADEYGDGRCCEGLDLIGGICTLPEKQADSCNQGCLDANGNCVPVGLRTAGMYCDISKELKPQLGGDVSCENHFECSTNLCVDGKCTTPGLIKKLTAFFQNLFGSETEDNPNFFSRLFGGGNDEKEERESEELIPACGNSIVEGGEECDDGNDNGADGCVACKFTCTDSDGGNNLSVKGTTTDISYSLILTDYCDTTFPNSVKEHYCRNDGRILTDLKPCANGCRDGACIPPLVNTCTDSDGGSDPKVKGVTRDSFINSTDSCDSANPNSIIEYSCRPDNFVKREVLSCANGCRDGACIPPLVNTCTDSDGGNNLSVKGTTTDSSVSLTITDYCDTTSPNSVKEHYCRSDGRILADLKPCPNGCRDGACL